MSDFFVGYLVGVSVMLLAMFLNDILKDRRKE